MKFANLLQSQQYILFISDLENFSFPLTQFYTNKPKITIPKNFKRCLCGCSKLKGVKVFRALSEVFRKM